MHSILFVDDSPMNLRVYKKLSRTISDSPSWRFYFCDDSLQACELVETYIFDAVVTDLEMPGIDGAHLLSFVADVQPQALRIIVSGEMAHSKGMRPVRLAHNYYLKPLNLALFNRITETVRFIKQLPLDTEARRSIGSFGSLPVPSKQFCRLVSHIQSVDATIKGVGDIVAADTVMSANILKLINTPFFGYQRGIQSVHQAVALLGIDLIRTLIVIQYLHQMHRNGERDGAFTPEYLQEFALSCMQTARFICDTEKIPPEDTRIIILASVLMDIGKYLIESFLPMQLRRFFTEDSSSICDGREKQYLGVSHQEAGAYLLTLWGFDMSLISLIINHHRSVSSTQNFIGFIVGAVSGIVHSVMDGRPLQETIPAETEQGDVKKIYGYYAAYVSSLS
ncbi:MAG: HDOD domain-containing protein [Fibrobacterota bacterium]